LVFGTAANIGPGDAVLLEGDAAPPEGPPNARYRPDAIGHAPGCACCRSRTGAAEALRLLFLARALGGQEFQRVVALTITAPGRDAVSRALAEDVFAAARFRLQEAEALARPYPPGPAGAA
jgi:hypothetical protein